MNTIFPPIILNKIDWYRWKFLQYKVCIEYHHKFTYDPRNFLIYKIKTFNVTLNDRTPEILYEMRNFITNNLLFRHLPKNYFYSNDKSTFKDLILSDLVETT